MSLALVGCNSFYASCEQVFRPDLQGRAVVVLSNNDGCVVARSKDAKTRGIKMGEPWFQVQQRLREEGDAIEAVTALSSNYVLYADLSNHVMRLLARFAPRQEISSIDECFLDLNGMPEAPATMGADLRRTVLRWTGLPVCVGPIKPLAKLANHFAKQDPAWAGVCDLEALLAVEIDRLLASLVVAEVWGIGARLAQRLQALGIRTALDLCRASPHAIRQRFSVVLERTVLELGGIACLEFEEIKPDKQQIRCSRSFGATISNLEELTEAITTFTSRAAEKLRAQQGEAAAIAVEIRTSAFRSDEQTPALYRQPGGAAGVPNRRYTRAGRRRPRRVPASLQAGAGLQQGRGDPAGSHPRRAATAGAVRRASRQRAQPGLDGDAGSRQPPLRARQPEPGQCPPDAALATARAVPLATLHHAAR